MENRREYTTKARTEILDFLQKNQTKTVSAIDIMNYLNSISLKINRTTVYRYLESLCDKQIISKYADDSGEKSVYKYCGVDNDCGNHLHLRCTECGKIVHLDCSFMKEMNKHIFDEHGFSVDYKGSIISGKCKECIKIEKKT